LLGVSKHLCIDTYFLRDHVFKNHGNNKTASILPQKSLNPFSIQAFQLKIDILPYRFKGTSSRTNFKKTFFLAQYLLNQKLKKAKTYYINRSQIKVTKYGV